MQRAMNQELDLKMISSLCYALSEFVYVFLFDSCTMSQNVTFCNHLHEVNSKFHVMDHKLYQALCFVLSKSFEIAL